MSGRPLILVRSVSIGEEERVVGVEQWAEIRRMHRVERLSIREIGRARGCIARRSVGR